MEFQYVAFARYPEGAGENLHTPGHDTVAPLFVKGFVVCVFMQERAVHRPEVLGPLLFNVDEGPPPSAEGKMLQPGEEEEILFLIFH